MMFEADVTARAAALIGICRQHNLLLSTAESCTGGLIAGLITSIPGSSDVFDAGFVTYSNEAKTRMIGVPAHLIAAFGAVSAEVARSMALGAIENSRAGMSIAVTGVAGPGGGTPNKPVGLVHCAVALRNGKVSHNELRLGAIGREEVRLATIRHAIDMAYDTAALFS